MRVEQYSDGQINRIIDIINSSYRHWKNIKKRDELIELIIRDLKSSLNPVEVK